MGSGLSGLDLTEPGTHVETYVEKRSFSLGEPSPGTRSDEVRTQFDAASARAKQLLTESIPDTLTRRPQPDARKPAHLQDVPPGSIEPVGGSLLASLWKAAVLVGIALIIWLLLHRR